MSNFKPEEWSVTEENFETKNSYQNESVFALSNGFFGTRGTLEELRLPRSCGLEGNFVNGFYESEPIRYGEKGYAFPDVSQTMLNVPDAKSVSLLLDGKRLRLTPRQITAHRRSLLLREGESVRRTEYRLPDGRMFRIEAERFVSMKRKNLMCLRFSVTPLNFSGTLSLETQVNGDVKNSTKETNARIDYGPYGRVLREERRENRDGFTLLEHRVKNTGFLLVTAVSGSAEGARISGSEKPLSAGTVWTFSLSGGQTAVLDRFVCYASSTDLPEASLAEAARRILREAKVLGFEALRREQADFYTDFWNRADVCIRGDAALQQGMRFNLFHLMQGAGRDGKTGIGAKCLTGEGYEGHTFWDTEMYALPFFLCCDPGTAEKFIEFRYRTLPQARERARQLDCSGALFPWRTINGREASPYYPAGTAQFHIDADIAYAVDSCLEAAKDNRLLADMGAELLLETARFWLSFGCYSDARGGAFCLNCVTGPDEYTALVNNNYYTNLMAQYNLRAAVRAWRRLGEADPAAQAALGRRCGVSEDEMAEFSRAADAMYLPGDPETGICWQDDSFAQKKPLEIRSIPAEKLPIADHMHFLTLYRHQVLKQADTLLAMMVQSDRFSDETVRRNFDYYEPKTIHESSLSQCVHSILASRIGYREKAYDFFLSSARLDLDNVQGNTHAGVHMANLAGTWMCVVYGFAGMRRWKGTLQFRPWLPEQWEGYSFRAALRGSVIEVRVDPDGTKLSLRSGAPVKVYLFGCETEVR